MNEEYVSFVVFIIINNDFVTCATKKSCFKYIADVDTLDVYIKSGGNGEWGEVGEQVSSWDLPLAYQGGEKSLFMMYLSSFFYMYYMITQLLRFITMAIC